MLKKNNVETMMVMSLFGTLFIGFCEAFGEAAVAGLTTAYGLCP